MRAETGTIRVLAVGVDAIVGAEAETSDDLLGALARLSDGGIDAVLLTLDLPEGLDAVAALKERAPEVAVIAVADDDRASRAIEAGATDVVPDTADEELLERALRYAVVIERMRAELHRREIVDETTGLYNARGFAEFAAHHLALADRAKEPLVLLSVRIDGLDELEEAAARSVRELGETADALRSAVRDCDVVARTDAGSFGVLLTGDAAGAESLVLSRLVDAVAVTNARAGHPSAPSLSVGAATYDPSEPVSLEELLAAARRGERREPTA